MISATDVFKQIRRSLLQRFLGYMVMSAVLAAIVAHYSAYGDPFINVFTLLSLAACVAIIVVYPGKYVPITNKHESLLNKYGSVYLAEADKAMSKLGMDRMLSICWFKLYAGNFCARESTSNDA